MVSNESIKDLHLEFVKYGNELLKEKGYNFEMTYSNYSFDVLTNNSAEFFISPCHLIRCEKLSTSIKFTLIHVNGDGDEIILFQDRVLTN